MWSGWGIIRVYVIGNSQSESKNPRLPGSPLYYGHSDVFPCNRRLALMSVVSSDTLNQQQGMIEFNVALLRKAILQILEAIGRSS
jgi:hypothetical protein